MTIKKEASDNAEGTRFEIKETIHDLKHLSPSDSTGWASVPSAIRLLRALESQNQALKKRLAEDKATMKDIARELVILSGKAQKGNWRYKDEDIKTIVHRLNDSSQGQSE